MRRVLAVLLALALVASVRADVVPTAVVPTNGGSGGGASVSGTNIWTAQNEFSGQTNISGPDATTNVEIGSVANNANAGVGGTNVVIGNGANVTSASSGNVFIGSLAVGGVSSANNVGIGSGVQATGNGGVVAIGSGAVASSNNTTAIGAGASAAGAGSPVAVGQGAAAAASSVALGPVTATANSFRVGPIINQAIFAGTAPAVSVCGASPSVVTGSATAGRLTTGSGGTVQSCTLTFPTTWTTAPACIANDETAILLVRATATTTTLVIDSAVAGTLASQVLTYHCLGGS